MFCQSSIFNCHRNWNHQKKKKNFIQFSQTLNMIATLDLSNGVTLYSGVTCVGKVHITSVLSNIGGCNYFTNTVGGNLSSPFPRRSSLIPQSIASNEAKFEEALHLLSPVGGNCGRGPMLLENSLMDTSLQALKDAVGNKITLEYGSKVYCRISLPASSTSPLGLYQVY